MRARRPAVTTPAGQFTLPAPSGELIATGGIDTVTGLTLPGLLTAPAGSTVITPLTTLLDAYVATQGGTLASAQAAVAAALGLDPATDLTQLDPAAVAAGGDLSFLIASASVIDTAANFADLIAAQTGASQAAAFAAVFSALAQQAATGTLNLVSLTTMQAVLANAAAIAVPGTVLPTNVLQVGADIAQTGNYDVSTAATPRNGVTSLGFIDAVERVEQGQAAPQYATSAGDPASNVGGRYTYGLGEQVTAAEMPLLAAPVLAPGQDTGISPYDNDTSITDPVFTGIAPPGATVLLAASYATAVARPYSIVGSGTANAGGAYSITAQLGQTFNDVIAIQAAPGEATATGTPVSVPNLPASEVTLVIAGDLATTEYGLPRIQDVSYVASSANDATHSAIYVDGVGSAAYQPDGVYTLTADGNPTPLGTSAAQEAIFGIVSRPLANGPHSLVVTETFADGEALQSLPFTVTVTAPGSVTLGAQATGPITGGSIFGFEDSYELKGLGGNTLAETGSAAHPAGITDDTGTVTVPTLFNVPNQERTTGVDLTNGTVELVGGEDSLTGLPLPSDLLAPPGSAVINPVTTLVATAVYDGDLGPVGPATSHGRRDRLRDKPGGARSGSDIHPRSIDGRSADDGRGRRPVAAAEGHRAAGYGDAAGAVGAEPLHRHRQIRAARRLRQYVHAPAGDERADRLHQCGGIAGLVDDEPADFREHRRVRAAASRGDHRRQQRRDRGARQDCDQPCRHAVLRAGRSAGGAGDRSAGARPVGR